MRKYLLILIAFFVFTSCGDSKEEKAITNAIFLKYKEDAINSDTYVRFEVPSIKINNKTEFGDTLKYDVDFGIMEMYPDRNVYQKGSATLSSIKGAALNVDFYSYHECELRDLP